MKNNNVYRFIKNTILYISIAFCLYYLYSPLNRHANNITHSAISFVYQQF
jgi:hypothetical protein